MERTWNFSKCVSILTGEIELLRKISSAQDKVRKAVMSRDWEAFDENNPLLNRLSDEFSLLESEREALFSSISSSNNPSSNNNAESPFYVEIMGLPGEEQIELARLYRELKMEALKMRALNETFMAYLNEARSLAASYLEAVCPARGGKLYTRKGRRVSQDLQSIVINNRF